VSGSTIAWRRVSLGLYLMGFGVLLLLSVQGYLRWSFWREAVSFWPVLLVGVGIRVVFERTRAPWLVLLSPLVVLGTLAAIAAYGPADPTEPTRWEPLRVERPERAEEWALLGRWHHAQVGLRAAELDGQLMRGRCSEDSRVTVGVYEANGHVRVRAGTRHHGPQWLLPGRRSACELDLEASLPLDIQLELVLAEGHLDLTAARLSRAELEGAWNDLTLRLGRPSEDVSLDLSGAFNDLELVVPDAVPVSVSSDGPFNRVEGRHLAASRQGPGYRVYVDGAFNRLSVTSRQTLELEQTPSEGTARPSAHTEETPASGD
jgi:hypothetical protein